MRDAGPAGLSLLYGARHDTDLRAWSLPCLSIQLFPIFSKLIVRISLSGYARDEIKNESGHECVDGYDERAAVYGMARVEF